MEKSIAFNPVMNHLWDFGLFTLHWIKLSLFHKLRPPWHGLRHRPSFMVMYVAGMNYLLNVLDCLPSGELSQLILNLFISIPKYTKRILCTWNSSLVPLPCLSSAVNYPWSLSWASFGYSQTFPQGRQQQWPGLGDPCVPASFGPAVQKVFIWVLWCLVMFSLKTVDWNDCYFLACNAHGTVLLSPRELFRELLIGPSYGEWGNSYRLPRSDLWALLQGQGEINLSIER